MTYLQPFFLLMGRASVFWVGAAVLAGLSFVLAAIGQPNEMTTPYVDAVFLASFAFPSAAGWLAGAIIQEFLHCSFAWPLPSVLKRLAAGFVVTGLTISLVVAALASQSPANSLGFGTLLAIGLAGYGLCGNLFGPKTWWLGWIDFLALALMVTRSRALAELAAENPFLTIVISLGLGLFGLIRLFSRSDFRHRAFRLPTPFPGSYSLERSARYERAKRVQERPKTTGWKAGYLGTYSWNWVRAMFYESFGPVGWKSLPRLLNRFWVLGLIFVIYAWSDKGNLGFGEALGKTIYGALFGSPHVPTFGEQSDRQPIVILVIAAAGAVLSLWSPTSQKASLTYPLSRRRLASLTHRVGLIDVGVFFASIFLVLSVVGHLAGWLVGYPLRFDFMPFFLRPLLATILLIPLAQWGGLHLQVATQRRTDNTLVAVIFGVLGFVALVWVWTAFVPRLFAGPMRELSASALLILLSQGIYWSKLRSYYSTADLI
jgi:hypothetical protein